jgi:hypothetical protein
LQNGKRFKAADLEKFVQSSGYQSLKMNQLKPVIGGLSEAQCKKSKTGFEMQDQETQYSFRELNDE